MDWDLLESEINSQELNWTALAKQMDASDNGIRKAIVNKSMRLDMFEQLCEVLKVEPASFLISVKNPKPVAPLNQKNCCKEKASIIKELISILDKHK